MERKSLDFLGFPHIFVDMSGIVYNTKTQRIITGYVKDNGYVMLTLGKDYKILKHILVALAWIPNPKGLPEVNHKNLNKQHNYVSNLEWTTRIDNVRHWYTNSHGNRSEHNGMAKLSYALAEEIRHRHKTEKTSYSKLAKVYGVCQATISDICNNKKYVRP